MVPEQIKIGITSDISDTYHTGKKAELIIGPVIALFQQNQYEHERKQENTTTPTTSSGNVRVWQSKNIFFI